MVDKNKEGLYSSNTITGRMNIELYMWSMWMEKVDFLNFNKILKYSFQLEQEGYNTNI